eukprot:sb/3474132/
MAQWTIVPRDSVVHHHFCHEGGARVVQVAREPAGRTEFVILKPRPQGVFLEYLCHDQVYLSHDRRECDKFPTSQAMMCHRCESGAIALSHVIGSQRDKSVAEVRLYIQYGRGVLSATSVYLHNCIFLLVQLNFSQKMQWCK